MEIQRIIKVKTPATRWIMEKKLRNDVMFIDAIMIKLSRIYDLARKKQSLYAYINLSRVLSMVYRIRSKMDKSIGNFEKIIADSKFDLTKVSVPDLGVYKLRVGVVLGAELCSLLESYDHLYLLIQIADKMSLFKTRAHGFRIRSQFHRRIMELLTHIISMDETKLSQVSIEQYLERTEAYLEAAKLMGEVNPGALFAALNVDMFPRLPPMERNTVINKLKQME